MPAANTVAQMAVIVTADTSQAEKGLSDLGTKVGSAGSMLTTAFTGAAVAGIAAVGAGLVASVAAASDFEKTMSGVKAVSGATSAEMDALSAKALELGAKTAFSASEAGKGIEELVKGGLTVQEAMTAAEATLNLAAAGGISVADSATIAANALAQFNLPAEKMAHVSDLIAGAANASALDVGQFKFSLQAAGAVASTVGFNFDDLSQAIAVMGKAGITGSDAGTSLKTMMLNLQPSTKKQSELMRDLGLITADGANQFFDASGKVKSMADVAGTLQTALAGMTEQQKIATLNTLFGSDAIRAGAVLAKAGAEGFNDMAAAMGKVTAETVGKDKLDNLSGSMEQMNGSIETLGIAIGTALLPALRSIVDGATSVINALMPFAQQVAPQVGQALAALVAQLRELFGGFISWFTDNWPLISKTYETVAADMATTNVGIAANTQTSWGSIRDIITLQMSAIGDTLKLAMHVINGDWEAAWQDIENIADTQWKTIVTIVGSQVTAILALVDVMTGGLLTKIGDAFTALIGAFTDGWAAVQTITETMWVGATGIAATIASAWDTIATNTATAGQALNNVIVGIWDAIYTSVIQPHLDTITNAVGAAWDAISTKTHEIFDPILIYIRDNTFGPISESVVTSSGAASTAWSTALDAISTKAHAILDPILTYIRDTIFEPIQHAVEAAMSAVSSAFETSVNAVKTTVDSTLSGIKSVWETTWAAIQTAAESPKAAMDTLIGLVEKLKSVMPEWLIPHSPTPFQVRIEGIMKAATEANAKVSGFLSGAGKVPGALDDWLNAAIGVSGVGADWLDGLRWLAMHESTGNPTAVNPFDVNNVLNGPGPHAMGLMQTIPSTFRAYRNKDLPDDIFDPVANAVASISYIQDRYGSIQNVISGWARRGGYESGGWAGLHGPELAWLGEGGPEYVVKNSDLRRGGGGSGGHQTLTLNVAIGGRIAEQIVVEGYELAASRGRLPGISRGRLPAGVSG